MSTCLDLAPGDTAAVHGDLVVQPPEPTLGITRPYLECQDCGEQFHEDFNRDRDWSAA